MWTIFQTTCSLYLHMGPQVRIRQDTAHSRVSEMGTFFFVGESGLPSTGPVYLGTSAIRGCICMYICIYIYTHHLIISSHAACPQDLGKS